MKFICTLIILVFSSQNALATYVCKGEVKGLAIDPKNGAVLAETIATLTWPKLCSVKQDMNGVSVDVCKTIYSTLLSAQLTGKSVMLWFDDEKDCSLASHPAWQELTGWYFGPMLTD